MSDDPWSPLEELAATNGGRIIDRWTSSSLLIRNGVDVDLLAAIAERPGFTVRLLFDNSDLPLTLDTGLPSNAELSALKGLIANASRQSCLTSATPGGRRSCFIPS